jgi:hypothetical protein
MNNEDEENILTANNTSNNHILVTPNNIKLGSPSKSFIMSGKANINLNNMNNHSIVQLNKSSNNNNINNNYLTILESVELIQNLEKLVTELRTKKKKFKDKSRLFCCLCFTTLIIIAIIVFYIFDVLKYEENCRKNKKTQMEIQIQLCDSPSIGFWPRFFFIIISTFLLIFGLYCSGPTVVIFEPGKKKLSIDKKKFFCLPSIYEYSLDKLSHACIESDSSDGMPNLSTFSFYSVTLVFNSEDDEVVNLGLGRDCFFLQEKIELVNNINKYLEAIKLIK